MQGSVKAHERDILFKISTVTVEEYVTDRTIQVAIVCGNVLYIFGLSITYFGAIESKNSRRGSKTRI